VSPYRTDSGHNEAGAIIGDGKGRGRARNDAGAHGCIRRSLIHEDRVRSGAGSVDAHDRGAIPRRPKLAVGRKKRAAGGRRQCGRRGRRRSYRKHRDRGPQCSRGVIEQDQIRGASSAAAARGNQDAAVASDRHSFWFCRQTDARRHRQGIQIDDIKQQSVITGHVTATFHRARALPRAESGPFAQQKEGSGWRTNRSAPGSRDSMSGKYGLGLHREPDRKRLRRAGPRARKWRRSFAGEQDHYKRQTNSKNLPDRKWHPSTPIGYGCWMVTTTRGLCCAVARDRTCRTARPDGADAGS
jgi:hypothetical protein